MDELEPTDEALLVEELKRAMCCPHYKGKCYAEMTNISCAARSYEQRARAILPILTRELAKAKADAEMLAGALVAHNEMLRSACAIADRDGKDTNWLSFRGQCHYTLAEYHELVNAAREMNFSRLEAQETELSALNLASYREKN